MAVLTIAIAAAFVLAAGFPAGWRLRWRLDAQQLRTLTTQLSAEARIDATTRAVLAAMRDAAREHRKQS